MTRLVMITKGGGCGGGNVTSPVPPSKGGVGVAVHTKSTTTEEEEEQNQFSLLELLLAALRKSMVYCRIDRKGADEVISAVHQMEIGWPTNVQHITHVTFDRFNGFLGLPVEFQVEVPCKAPSASASVFGVSAESMQCSYDSKGNSVPTILLLMQQRLYSQDGLKAEGIFRINPENSQEQKVRDELNRGIIPNDIDVHCLAGLIKAWFRELPSSVLDDLSPEQVLNCNNEEDYTELVKQLKPTESALLNWAVDLMADVVEEEEFNKMNARNIAMVFAPNMTRMLDPLTALMHAVQVMNLLKTLITRTLRKRGDGDTDVDDNVEDEVGKVTPAASSSLSDDEEQHYVYDSCHQQEEMDMMSCDVPQSAASYCYNDNDMDSVADSNQTRKEEEDAHESSYRSQSDNFYTTFTSCSASNKKPQVAAAFQGHRVTARLSTSERFVEVETVVTNNTRESSSGFSCPLLSSLS